MSNNRLLQTPSWCHCCIYFMMLSFVFFVFFFANTFFPYFFSSILRCNHWPQCIIVCTIKSSKAIGTNGLLIDQEMDYLNASPVCRRLCWGLLCRDRFSRIYVHAASRWLSWLICRECLEFSHFCKTQNRTFFVDTGKCDDDVCLIIILTIQETIALGYNQWFKQIEKIYWNLPDYKFRSIHLEIEQQICFWAEAIPLDNCLFSVRA